MSKHNKRRTTSFVHEALVRKISRSLVEGDQRSAALAVKVLKRAFRPGTELHRELRLARALLEATVSSPALALSIVDEAKEAARSFDAAKLDREKSLLIRNINHRLGDHDVFEATVPGYRMHATVGTLLGEWRRPAGSRDLARVAEFEDRLVQWLTTEKVASGRDEVIGEESRTDLRLLQRAMLKRIDERYSGTLTPAQKEIVRLRALSIVRGANEPLIRRLEEVRRSALAAIDARLIAHPNDAYANGKLSEVKDRLLAEDLSAIDDALVSRFMLHEKLRAEIEGGEEDGDDVG